MVVTNNKAYIGVTKAGTRDWRRNPENDAEILCYCLEGFEILWRKPVETDGLTNMITQPFVSDDSAYKAVNTKLVIPPADTRDTKSVVTIETRNSAGKSVKADSKLSKIDSPPNFENTKVGPQNVENQPESVKTSDAKHVLLPNDGKTRVKLYKNDYTSKFIEPHNLIGGEWPSGMKFIDLHWKGQGAVTEKTPSLDMCQLMMGNVKQAMEPLRQKLLSLSKFSVNCGLFIS